MTFKELDHELPNGFHDAILHDLRIDYLRGSAVLRMELDFGDPDGPKPEDYRSGEVKVTGMCFCSIDPPSHDHPYVPDGYPLNVSGDPAKPDRFPAFEELSRTLPPGVLCYRFYVDEWNSFINIAAKDVQISWVDEGTRAVE